MNIINLAQELLNSDGWVILDTETTGLDDTAEACQIGILAPTGKVLLDTLVNTFLPIPSSATQIHGITNEHIKDAPRFLELIPTLKELLVGKKVVVYNADYDYRILYQSSIAHFNFQLMSAVKRGLKPVYDCWINNMTWLDVMEPYAEYWGAWSDYHQSYTWQSLVSACHQQDIDVIDENSAIGDCKMTLALLCKLGS